MVLWSSLCSVCDNCRVCDGCLIRLHAALCAFRPKPCCGGCWHLIPMRLSPARGPLADIRDNPNPSIRHKRSFARVGTFLSAVTARGSLRSLAWDWAECGFFAQSSSKAACESYCLHNRLSSGKMLIPIGLNFGNFLNGWNIRQASLNPRNAKPRYGLTRH